LNNIKKQAAKAAFNKIQIAITFIAVRLQPTAM